MLRKILKTKRESIQNSKIIHGRESGILEMCRKCYSFKYDNSWHFERPEYLLENDSEEKTSVKFSQCPACIEESLAMYDVEYV